MTITKSNPLNIELECVGYSFDCSLQRDQDEPKLSDLEKELKTLSEEEVRLLAELEALNEQEEVTTRTITEQEELAKKITQEEDIYWKEYVRLKREWLEAEDQGRR